MTRNVWVVAGVIAAGVGVIAVEPGVARADELRATREQPMVETAHTVDIRLADGIATYTVRRMFSNPGKVADQVELQIGLPYGAAATGLRIRAGERWHLGELMERDRAAALYKEMTGFGAFAPKDPALLAWLWADTLSLQVFPVMPGTVSTVEYTLTAPTRYQNGRYVISYPRVAAGSKLAMPVVTVRPAWGHHHLPIFIDGTRVTRDTPTALTPPVHQPWEDAVERSPSASYVASEIVVPVSSHTTKTFATATVQLELPHTYQSDVRVELVTPGGERVMLHDRTGSGANDIRGKHVLPLPAGTTGAGSWRLVVSDHAALDTGSLDRWSLTLGSGQQTTVIASTDTPLFVPDAPEDASEAGVATIAIAPPVIATWIARLGRVVASDTAAFARLEIDVAPQLVPMPTRAQVVFVIDTSYSMTERGVAAQLDVVRAYLAHVPDAEVEIVTYRRRAARVFGRFVPATAITAALTTARRRGAFTLGNGSALDDGARLAAASLSGRIGPRRVVLATDELLRSSLGQPETLAALAALAPATVVHVVVPKLDDDDRVQLHRRDDATLAPLATAHHGIYVDLAGLPAANRKALVPVVLELVRPTRIEKVAVHGFELETEVLHEGDGVRLMIDTTRATAPTTVTLTGTMWSDPVTTDIAVGTAFSTATAAFVFGADAHHALSEAEQMTVALMGRAVSPVTSYLATEPGVRPSTIGLEEFGTIGTGRFGTIGHGSGGGGVGRSTPDFERLIDPAACIRRIKPAGAWQVRLAIETTLDEVVEVVPAAPSAMANCLAETVWQLRLDRTTFSLDHEAFTVVLSGPAAPRGR